MMKLPLNPLSLSLSLMSVRSAHSFAPIGKRSKTTAVENKTAAVAQGAISDYANIFTQEGQRVLIHTALPPGKPPEKRMTFVKLYMYANHLIGNTNISLAEITNICNKEGYRSKAVKGNKTAKVLSGNFKSSLQSNLVKNLFQFTSDEDGKACVSLTNQGLDQIGSLAGTLNAFDPEEPQGRLREILVIFKKEGLLQARSTVSINKLRKLCEKNQYNILSGNLRSLVSADFARQFFVFDRERDTIRLSPIGIKMTETLS